MIEVIIGARLLPAMALEPRFIAAGVALLALSCVLIPMAMMGRSIQQPLADRLSWAGMLMMGFFSSLLVLTVLREFALLLGLLVLPSLAAFSRWSALLFRLWRCSQRSRDRIDWRSDAQWP